jgi:anti-sigma regulatory factor (Ser/Thr protein kinase)
VTVVVRVPAHFDDASFDQFAGGFESWPPESRVLVDARGAQWASPYALIGVLTAGQAIAEAKGERPILTIPESDEVRSYWARIGFFRHAEEFFELNGRLPRARSAASDALLDITPVRGAEDVHQVVGDIQERAAKILHGELGLETNATMGFAMALSESCQNIVEHAGTGGWVGAQAYTYRRRPPHRRVVTIAVSDAGLGFRRSLEPTQAKRYGDRWRDGAALEAALLQGVSRFRDPGRGQGLAGIKRYLARWDGKISIRSGTARLAIVPSWDQDDPLKENLAFFPGAQVQVTIPAQTAEAS